MGDRSTCAVQFTRREELAAWSEWRALVNAVNAVKRERGKQRRTLARALAGALRRDLEHMRRECSRFSIDPAAALAAQEAALAAERASRKYRRRLTDAERTELARAQLVKARAARAEARAARKAAGLPDTPGTTEKRARRLGMAGGDELGEAFRPAE